jgi:hypothetical protein
MVVVPAAMQFIRPVEVLTVAMDGLLLLHVPPDGALVQVIDVPMHDPDIPVIGAGTAFTVTMAVTKLDSTV